MHCPIQIANAAVHVQSNGSSSEQLKANPRNAQVLFTTHDTRLIGTAANGPLLRRDQIWFAEKNHEGASTIYPLTDYQPRETENLERGYLQGRYGAIPFCGDISWIQE